MSAEGQLFQSQATVSYNGVSIDNIVSSSINASPVYNEQGTAVKYVMYTVQVEAIVHPESFVETASGRTATNDALEVIRQRLLEPRKPFNYDNKGFGDDFIITSGETNSLIDVAYGPKPLNLTFEPIANNKAARVNWTVEVKVPKFCTGTSNNHLEFWSTSSVKINKHGYQTLTRKGRVEFVGASTNNNLGLRASEQFGPFIDSLTSPTSMEGYHLEHDFNFSPDDRVLDFSLTYTEIESPNVYPLGVVNITAKHSVKSELMSTNIYAGAAFRSWGNTMTCTISLRPNVPQLRAWEIFSAITSARLNQNVSIEVQNINGQDVVTRVKVPIVLALSVEENIFEHSISFSMRWVSFTQSINDLFHRTDGIVNSGMFRPVDTNTWNDWVIDIRNGSQNRFGSHPLTDLGITDQINDNCSPLPLPLNVPDTTRGGILFQVPAIFAPACPPESASWLDYQNKCEIESSASKTVHRRYKSADSITRSDDQILPHTSSTSVSRQFDTTSSESDHLIQDFGNDKHMGVLRGYAIRIGRPTEPPRVTSIGGQSVLLQRDKSKISNVVVSANNLCSVHITKWTLKYEILGFPSGNIETEIESTGGSEQFQ